MCSDVPEGSTVIISSTKVANAAMVGAACSCMEPELSTTKMMSTAVQPQSSSSGLQSIVPRSLPVPTSNFGSSPELPSGLVPDEPASVPWVLDCDALVSALPCVAVCDADAEPVSPNSPVSSP